MNTPATSREQISATLQLTETDRSRISSLVQQVISRNSAFNDFVEIAHRLKTEFPGVYTSELTAAVSIVEPDELEIAGVYDCASEPGWIEFSGSEFSSSDPRVANFSEYILSRVNIHKPNVVVLDLLETEDAEQGDAEVATACIIDATLSTQEVTFYTTESGNDVDVSEAYQQVFTDYFRQVTQP